MPGPKYVKDFEFPSGFGFSGSAGQVAVRGHARQAPRRYAEGGQVKTPKDVTGAQITEEEAKRIARAKLPAPPPEKKSLVDIMKGKGREEREKALGLKKGGRARRVCKAMGGPVKASKGGMKKVADAELAKHIRAPKPRGHGVK